MSQPYSFTFSSTSLVGGGQWADGRNQVIAACGNGSLRLFDVTLEVSDPLLMRGVESRADGRVYQLKYGMNIPQRYIR